MTSFLLEEISHLKLATGDPEEWFITSGVSWEQYEDLLAYLEDSLRYRITYLEGMLEIMSPSRRHESNKKIIAMLLEAYLQSARIRFWPLGSTTFRRLEQKAGKEPDESYCIETEKEFPDLAIEIVLSSGGLDKLKVYQKLDVKEVWFWQNNQFSVYHLLGDDYELIPKSELLPKLDLALLAEYVTHPNPLEAVLEWRERISRPLVD